MRTDQFGIRPLYPYEGSTLLHRVLSTRPWREEIATSDYIFVTREVLGVESLLDYLNSEWPDCKVVLIPTVTDGAMLTALVGVALCKDDEPILVDLADMQFGSCDPMPIFSSQDGLGAIIPVFESTEPTYSYLISENGKVVGAREKIVIGNQASAGVYFFRNREIYLRAASYCMAHRDLKHKGNYFICPMANGVLADGWQVATPSVSNVKPIGNIFHRSF